MICLVRHGETAWSRDGRHTGRTDLPLTPTGERAAAGIAKALAGRVFTQVWTSPLQRARHTCELSGFGDVAISDDRLMEWDYGDYEGLTSASIRADRPSWSLLRDGCPGGEQTAEVVERVQSFLTGLGDSQEGILVFSSGHLLRLLTTVWLGCDPTFADHLPLDTASISILDYDARHAVPTISLWNHRPGW